MRLGKEKLYQWERGVYLEFDENEQINQVHFSHVKYGKSIDMDVVQGKCEIPETLLRTSGILYAWGVFKGENSLSTEFVQEMYANPRPRPADYVYTPEELKEWEDLQKQIGDLTQLETEQKNNLVNAINEALKKSGGNGGNVSAEQIAEIVEQYLKENPPKIEEKDPLAVKSVNGEKPDENGNVEIEVGGGTGGSADNGWKHIRTVTIPEDITTDMSGVNFAYATADVPENGIYFGFDTDKNGEEFEYKEILVFTENASSPAASGRAIVGFATSKPVYDGGVSLWGVGYNNVLKNGVTHIQPISKSEFYVYGAVWGGGDQNAIQTKGMPLFATNAGVISKINACILNQSGYGYSAGSNFEFYGR